MVNSSTSVSVNSGTTVTGCVSAHLEGSGVVAKGNLISGTGAVLVCIGTDREGLESGEVKGEQARRHASRHACRQRRKRRDSRVNSPWAANHGRCRSRLRPADRKGSEGKGE